MLACLSYDFIGTTLDEAPHMHICMCIAMWSTCPRPHSFWPAHMYMFVYIGRAAPIHIQASEDLGIIHMGACAYVYICVELLLSIHIQASEDLGTIQLPSSWRATMEDPKTMARRPLYP